jgi:hypothetical protein
MRIPTTREPRFMLQQRMHCSYALLVPHASTPAAGVRTWKGSDCRILRALQQSTQS